MADQTEVFVRKIEESKIKNWPLGRHVEHDPQSREYPVIGFLAQADQPIISVLHKRHVPPYGQGNLGSCTGNAEAGLLMTDPYYMAGRNLTVKDAVRLYEKATQLDQIPGKYPPDDTGSSGLAVMKAARSFGYISGYRHTFGLDAALRAISTFPVITGVGWYEGFDRPDPHGFVRISGSVRGGHEFEIVGLDTETKRLRACNSWGAGWGDGGFFEFSWDDFDRLLYEHGDVTVAVA
jgi:hypothetical protein